MIENLLRQLTTVRFRITATNLALVILFGLAVPLVLADHSFLVNRLEEVAEVELRVDRLLLQASTRVASSRTNFSRYIQGFTPDARDAIADAGDGIALLQETADLTINTEQQQTIEAILLDVREYQRLINEAVAERESEAEQATQLNAAALQLGHDISVVIEQTVRESESRVAATNEATLNEAQRRIIVFLSVYFVILGLSFLLTRSVQQSVTGPIAALQAGAEAFRQGKWKTTIPVSGNDELSSLAATFNQMARDLSESQIMLEDRVYQRSQSLEISAQVSRNLSSILDLDAFAIAVVDQLQSTFNYYYVQLYLTNIADNNLTLKSATGLPGQKMLVRGHKVQIGSGIVGKSAITKSIVYSPDVKTDPDWLNNPLLTETECEAAIPIVSRGMVLGVLDIQHSVPDGISEEEISLLQSISDQIAIALENARLFNQIQQQASYEALLNQMTQKIQTAASVEQVLQVTAQELGKALNAEYTSVQLGKIKAPANGHEKAI